MSSSANAWAVIVAAGRGLRFGTAEPKQFSALAGRPMAQWAVEPFLAHPSMLGVSLVVPPEFAAAPPEWMAKLAREGVAIVAGGEHRTDSVRLGLESVSAEAELVAVHDGARPLIAVEAITQVLEAAGPERGAIAARPVTDSLKRSEAGGRVIASVDRESLWCAETPQVFPRELIIDVHRRADADGVHESDCAALCQRYGIEITLVEIAGPNPKITRPEDLELAEAWIRRDERPAPRGRSEP